MTLLRTLVLSCSLSLLLGCTERPTAAAELESHFPHLASRILKPAPSRVALAVELPELASQPVRFKLGHFGFELRELELTGVAARAHGATTYDGRAGRSYWTTTAEGHEEWIERFDAGDGPIAEWELTGARFEAVDGAVMVVDDNGVGVVRVTAPAAWSADGTAGRAWLRVEGQRLALYTDLRGHVLVDPLWAATSPLPTGVSRPSVTLLLDGTILVAGGQVTGDSTAAAARYDPTTGTWTSVPMNVARQTHTATLLKTGQVLVTGGFGAGTTTATCELFNPATNMWTLLPASGNMTSPRNNHTATLLANGKVLVAGGSDTGPALNTAELFDPATRTWATTGAMPTPRYGHRSVRLQDGTVLAISGSAPQLTPSLRTNVERYNPTTGMWTATGAIGAGRTDFSATVLANGEVLVAAGNTTSAVTSCERYSPSTGMWTATGALTTARRLHAATLLPNGRVLVAGGFSSTNMPIQGAEQYDPTAGTWSSAGSLAAARADGAAGLLPNGKAILVGGVIAGAYSPSVELYDLAHDGGTVTATGSMITARTDATSVQLATGQLLIIGGVNGSGTVLNTAELYTPSTGTWAATGSMSTARKLAAATLLSSGKVLVTGGNNGTSALASAELYDPSTGTWSTSTPMLAARQEHTATTRLDGTVLVVGGIAGSTMLNTSEVFALESSTWTAITFPMTSYQRREHTATLLSDGSVFVAGGYSNSTGTVSTTTAVCDPSGAWSLTGSIINGRVFHTATRLPNGKVLIAGGTNTSPTANALLYTPGVPALSQTAAIPSGTPTLMPAVRMQHTAVLLPNGKVLLAGGSDSGGVVATTALFDPALGTWSPGPTLGTARNFPYVSLLPTGKALVAGGVAASAITASELYDEGRGAQPAWTPTITAAPSTIAPDAGLTLTGTLFEGVGEGGSGGLGSFSSGLPLVQLRSVENDRRHWLTSNTWSATSLSIRTPVEVPTGLYWLSVTAGGVQSTERLLEFFVPVVASPATATRAPRQTLTLTPSGGNGAYGWSMASAPSGGSVVGGVYTAGTTGSVTDVVRLTDGQGRTATATITVGPSLAVSPATVSRAPRAAQTFTTSGGSGTGITFDLQTNNSGGSITTAGAYQAGTTGSVTDVVRATDSLGNVATATVTVTAIATITPAAVTLPPRGTQTFTASGGSATGFSFTLQTNNSGGSITAGGAYTAGATPNVTDTVRVTDSLGNTAIALVSVTAGVSINPTTPSRPPLGSLTFSASGGSGTGFTWTMVTNNSGGSITAGGAYTAGSTEAVDTVRVTDSLGNTATTTVTVTGALAVTPSTLSLAPRATQLFTATGGSGTGYTWELLTNNSGATFVAATASYTAGAMGGAVDTVRVTDSLGNRATATITVTAGVVAMGSLATTPPKGAASFSAMGGSNTGFTWTLSTNASGGTITASTGQYVAGPTGNVSDVIQVADSLGNTATAMISVSAGVSVTPATPAVAPNGTVVLTASGGSGTGYVWTITSVPSNGTINGNTGEYRAGATGGVSDTVRVVDSLGNQATVTVTIAGGLLITPAAPSLAPRARQTFSAVGGSGTGYQWSLISSPSGGTIDAATGAYRAGSTGEVTDVVEVRDSLNNTARTNVTVTTALSLTPASANVAPRASVAFVAAGGSGVKTFALTTNGSGATLDATTGAYTAGATPGVTDEVTVTDEVGATAKATLTITTGVIVTPATLTVSPGATQTFTATGGSGVGYRWTLDTDSSGGSIDASTGEYVAGAQPGTDVVLVTDSVGNTALATVSVVAGQVGVPTTPFSQRPPVSGWSCGCGSTSGDAGVLSLLALGLLALRRPRRRAGAVIAVVALLSLPVMAGPAKKKAPKATATKVTPAPEPTQEVAPTPAPVVTPPPEPPKKTKRSVAVLDVNVTVPNETLDGQAFTEMVVNSLEGTGLFTVMSARDIATLLGIERQKQLIGCDEDSTCMAEIANAMGSEFVISASVGKVGNTYLVAVKMVDGPKSRIVGRATLQTEDANALLGAVWRATQQTLDAYGTTLQGVDAEKWNGRQKQEPPVAISAQPSVPNYFGVTLLAVGGLQVLSDPGRRGSIGAEVDLTFRRGRLDLGAGVIIGPNLGARISASWALIDTRVRLGVGVRGAGYPGLGLFGGGLGVNAEFALNRIFGVTAIGAAEIYPAPGTPVVALLGCVGATARF